MSEYKTTLQGAPIVVRFTYYRADDGGRDYPSSPAYVEIEEVVIGGIAVASNHFSEMFLCDREDEIMADVGRSLKEEDDCCRWEHEQERRMEEGYP
jgi:hypothetical protein